MRRDLRTVFATVVVAVAGVLVVSTLLQGWDRALTAEGGAIELTGLAVFALGGVLVAWQMPAHAWRRWWPIPAIFVLFCLRELDVHDAFFTPGLLQTRIFTSPVPIWQKAVSALAMGGILLTLVLIVTRGIGPLGRALWQGRGWAWSVVIGVVMAIASVLVDGADRQLAAIGVTLPGAESRFWTAIEEVLELGFALSLLLAVCIWDRTGWPRHGVNATRYGDKVREPQHPIP